MASLKLTLMSIALLLLAVVAANLLGWPYAEAIAAPVLLLTVNLIFAILYQPAFKRDSSLLLFHVALAMLLPVALYGSLAGFQGRFELPEGAGFAPEQLVITQQGPLHPYSLDELSLSLQAMEATYVPGKRAQRLRARVWHDQESWVVAEHLPLVWRGYRINVSKNIGFSALLQFTDGAGQTLTHGVNFPWLAANELRQANEVALLGEPFWLKLEGVESMLEGSMEAVDFVPPAAAFLVLRQGERRVELRPGQEIAINGGRLRYLGLGSWQGFEVIYDPAKPFLLAIGLILCAAMGWYFYRRFSRYDWAASTAATRPSQSPTDAA
ncbi:cytochrome c biogenesis protein ResB [Shewanella sedimentimangrovi]|uniref:ResB-like domain-containing protein n=1 Tax=Shewanella sedimentimangrovi TaxID=2814293 RepID=A0ABX7R3N8_9GAMM|nr:hypothetical protein [Shewanella sedimentimangrovi]QSX37710.1 hypothetical protein JYB85_02385 [Shewanella sedimentimangrovi]